MRIALVDDSEIERGILLSLITDYGCEKQILFESWYAPRQEDNKK